LDELPPENRPDTRVPNEKSNSPGETVIQATGPLQAFIVKYFTILAHLIATTGCLIRADRTDHKPLDSAPR
jgi:hypothetical protein